MRNLGDIGSSPTPDENEPSLQVERTYRRWLRLYPTSFREQHGEEVLTTLLDGAGHPPRVQTREVLALATSAVCARARVGRGQRPSTTLEGLRWAVIFILTSSVMGGVWQVWAAARGDIWTSPELTGLAVAGLAATLLGWPLALRGKVTPAAVLVGLSTLTSMANNLIVSSSGQSIGRYGVINPWVENLGYPLFAMALAAAVAIFSLRSGSAVAVRPWRWRNSWLLVLAVLGGVLQGVAPHSPLATGASFLPLIAVAALMVLSIIEGRAAVAVAVLLIQQVLMSASWRPLILVVAMTVLAAILILRGVRRGRSGTAAATR